VLGTKLLKVTLQERTHGDNSVRHTLNLGELLLVEGGIVEELLR
jgi:hypothetical protein